MKSWGLLFVVSLLAIGCGGESGPTRYRLSGEVNFAGKAVPAGTIYFQPTTGPAGSARIKNGQYDTGPGQGIIGGKHKVMIEGFDGQGATSAEMGTPIFKPYTVEEDLPAADATINFDIPASAAEGLVIEKDPA
jgi:hypothetical protein